eukprot:364709-Chlamydomonas_euryale.AAC.13
MGDTRDLPASAVIQGKAKRNRVEGPEASQAYSAATVSGSQPSGRIAARPLCAAQRCGQHFSATESERSAPCVASSLEASSWQQACVWGLQALFALQRVVGRNAGLQSAFWFVGNKT